MKKYQPATISVRGGLNDEEQYGNVIPPIILSTNYSFIDFNQPRPYDYSRRGNPTRDLAAQTLADMEQGAGAVLTSSGMSALHLICTMLLKPGDLLIAPHDCYGGSYRLFNSQSQRGTYRVQFVDQTNPAAFKEAMAQRPKVVLIETPSNPLLRVVDIIALCEAAHQAGALTVVDNTFLSPVLQQPLTLGADMVVHSCTKYLNGHSDITAGAVICKDKQMLEDTIWWANNIGVTNAPFDSYLLLRGMRTLVPRVMQQQTNTLALINFLSTLPQVKKIYHPSLPENPGYKIACTQQKGPGAMFSFELNATEKQLKDFLRFLELFTLAESLGGVETLICHPSTMTHAGMDETARLKAGISNSLLRVSTGLESSDDLIEDIRQAISNI